MYGTTPDVKQSSPTFSNNVPFPSVEFLGKRIKRTRQKKRDWHQMRKKKREGKSHRPALNGCSVFSCCVYFVLLSGFEHAEGRSHTATRLLLSGVEDLHTWLCGSSQFTCMARGGDSCNVQCSEDDHGCRSSSLLTLFLCYHTCSHLVCRCLSLDGSITTCILVLYAPLNAFIALLNLSSVSFSECL